MKTTDIYWPRRRRRALTHLEALKAEWERAREKGQRVRWIEYEYEREEEDGPHDDKDMARHRPRGHSEGD